MNVLATSRSQPPTPELRTSTVPGSSRRKEALTLFSRVHIPQPQRNSMSPFFVLGQFLGFCDLLPANFPSELLPKNLKHFSSNLKCLALYQVLTKNFTQKAEMPEMLKWHFGRRLLSYSFVSCFEKTWVAVWNLVLASLRLETLPETFQTVSRNAETLALQLNHLREIFLETIKKFSLKRFAAPSPAEHRVFFQSNVKHSPTRPAFPFFRVAPVLFPFVTQSIF
jgi:hypothetical protein